MGKITKLPAVLGNLMTNQHEDFKNILISCWCCCCTNFYKSNRKNTPRIFSSNMTPGAF